MPDAQLLGLGADFLLDAGTTLYLRYEGQRFHALRSTPQQTQNTTSVGVAYRF